MPPKKINIRALNIHTENKCCNIKPRVEDKITRMIHSIKGFMTIRLKKKNKKKKDTIVPFMFSHTNFSPKNMDFYLI